jgi:hypothetical protein
VADMRRIVYVIDRRGDVEAVHPDRLQGLCTDRSEFLAWRTARKLL